jgi:Sec-independent protein translocase protein TatA
LFGAKRLPDSARALGRSRRIFTREMKERKADDGVIEEDGKTEK